MVSTQRKCLLFTVLMFVISCDGKRNIDWDKRAPYTPEDTAPETEDKPSVPNDSLLDALTNIYYHSDSSMSLYMQLYTKNSKDEVVFQNVRLLFQKENNKLIDLDGRKSLKNWTCTPPAEATRKIYFLGCKKIIFEVSIDEKDLKTNLLIEYESLGKQELLGRWDKRGDFISLATGWVSQITFSVDQLNYVINSSYLMHSKFEYNQRYMTTVTNNLNPLRDHIGNSFVVLVLPTTSPQGDEIQLLYNDQWNYSPDDRVPKQLSYLTLKSKQEGKIEFITRILEE